MAPLARLISAFGNAGAIANARRACEDRRTTEQRVDAAVARLTPIPEIRRQAVA
jgi:hypothetical protein